MTSHPEPVSQSMSLQQPPQSQYNMPDRDKQLLFSEFEDLSASFRSLYKSVFEQTFNQQGEWCQEKWLHTTVHLSKWHDHYHCCCCYNMCSIVLVFFSRPVEEASFDIQKQSLFAFKYFICGWKDYSVIAFI